MRFFFMSNTRFDTLPSIETERDTSSNNRVHREFTDFDFQTLIF